VAVSVWVASLPGAVGHVTAFGTGPLLFGSAGLIVLGLLRSPLRWAGALPVAIAVFGAIRTPLPDVLIAPDGASFAVRTANGRLAKLRTGSDSFAIQQWLAADADARSAKDKELAEGIRCDDAGCIGRLADGAIVAIARRPEAFEEDCRRAAVVVSARTAPPDCAALVVDRAVWQRGGAIALRHVGGKWEITAARPPRP
jgi:competence protein ComEC